MFIKKKLLQKSRVDKMANIKKENSKTWSEEAIDTLINCFQSHGCIQNLTSGDYKDKKRNSLAFGEIGMPVQEYNINRYDYKKLE